MDWKKSLKKTVQLTPREAQRYAKLGEDTENWSNTIFNDVELTPEIAPQFINKEEWKKHEVVHDQLTPIASRLKNLAKHTIETNWLVG